MATDRNAGDSVDPGDWHVTCKHGRMAKALEERIALMVDDEGVEGRPNVQTRAMIPGERALMIAVLEDAVRCFLGLVHYDRTNPEILARQAEHWIRLTDWESPFSFNNICEMLGLSPQDTRNAVLGWREMDPAQLESRIRILHTEASHND